MIDRILAPIHRSLRHIRRDRSGLAMLEFALVFPILLALGGWATELSALSLANMRISQLALNLADSASRVGIPGNPGVTQLREVDVNDIFTGVRLQSGSMSVGANGRVILSSLETEQQSYDTSYKRRIHWQRCFGTKSGAGYDSSYGTTSSTAGTSPKVADAGTLVPDGMGDTNYKIVAPNDNAVMFVEINYLYRPIFGTLFVKPQIIHHTASLLVRDNRDLTQIYNPSPEATRQTCNQYGA